MTVEELALRVALVEEKMNTHQAEYETALERMRADIANLETRMLDRQATNSWWQTAIILAGIGIAATVVIAVVG